jgi:predicted dehydrogenase
MITWGILGAGNIAGALVQAIRATGEGEVKAVGSRSAGRAAGFADAFAVPDSHGSYDALLADPALDAVYVATSNDLHHRNTLDAIAAGKAVLCEKPLALNARQAGDMAAAAGRAGVFLMEAMWMRFIPAIEELLRMTGRGDLGRLRGVLGDFGFPSGAGPGHRLVEPDLGGGALLDLGVYPISLAMMLLGEPAAVSAQAAMAGSGVDEQVAVTMGFPGGEVASAYASYVAASPIEAHVIGTEARVHLPSPMHHPQHLDVIRDGELTRISLPYEGTGYEFEVAEVHRALRAGETESPRRPLADTLAVMRVLDEVRSQIGVHYPGE